MDLQSVFSQMLILFTVIAVGYGATKCHVLDASSNRHFSNLVLCVTNPCTILYSVLSGEHILKNSEVLQLTGYSILIYACLIAAALVPRLLRAPAADAGLYRFMTVFSNVGFIGFPVVRAVFGQSAVF